MPSTVSLVVTAGPIRGQRYDFPEHDTFLFGRAPECHARLAASDTSASRHHFLLEVNPPLARLRDLGSLNGTQVNGVRHGGRRGAESPEEAVARDRADVDLRHGDEIRVGVTVIRVEVSVPPPPSRRRSRAWPRSGRRSRTATPRARASGPTRSSGSSGKGGMGAVYLARREGSEASPPVALKVMLPRTVVDEAAQEVFIREIEVTRAPSPPQHRGPPRLREARGSLLLRARVLPGRQRRAAPAAPRRPRSPPRTLHLAVGALEGLAAAHEAGFVHRDIKPDNVLLGEDGAARLADFGLAKSFQQAGLSGMTATGTVGGTFQFMPREQLTSYRQARPATDVWSMARHALLPAHRPVRPRLRGRTPTPWPSS